ncbi:MAG: pyridoxamine 5'-phosphate oxidase [Ignavibacteria bacterium]|nr:pyridoxamine 5'-phosphate oxidase [Ignavibacteria bacterium]
MDKKNLFELRKEFLKRELSEETISNSPFEQFETWFSEAQKLDEMEANTMYLATCSADGHPNVRTVLLKEYSSNGFIFYTNYKSRKGKELDENPNATLLFYWKELERQVRIEGITEKVSMEESENYFKSRPFESRVAAVVSEQSKVISSREVLNKKFEELKIKFADGNVPKPDSWGGYILRPSMIEFWQGRESRLHDRILFTKKGNEWITERLSP